MSTKNQKSEIEAKKVIEQNKKDASDEQLLKLVSDIAMDTVIKKTAKNRNIWKPQILSTFGKTDKSARRKLRNLQLDLSSAVIREIKLNNKVNAKSNAETLKKFYNANLVDFSIYSNVSEEVNPANHKIIHKAYELMKALTK